MDLTRRHFLGASGAAALAAGALLGGPVPTAAAADTFTAAEAAVVDRLVRLAAVFPRPFPGAAATRPRLARDGLDAATSGFAGARKALVRTGIQRIMPYQSASDERLLAAIAAVPPAELTALVAVAAHLVSDRCDPRRDDGASVWLAAVRRHAERKADR